MGRNRKGGETGLEVETLDLNVDPAIIERVEEYTASVSESVDQYLRYEEFYQSFYPGFE